MLLFKSSAIFPAISFLWDQKLYSPLWKVYFFPKTSFLYLSLLKMVFPIQKGMDYPLFQSSFLGIHFNHLRNVEVKLAFHYLDVSFLCIITLIFISSQMLVVNHLFFNLIFFWSSPSFHWDQHFQKDNDSCYKLRSIYLWSV